MKRKAFLNKNQMLHESKNSSSHLSSISPSNSWMSSFLPSCEMFPSPDGQRRIASIWTQVLHVLSYLSQSSVWPSFLKKMPLPETWSTWRFFDPRAVDSGNGMVSSLLGIGRVLVVTRKIFCEGIVQFNFDIMWDAKKEIPCHPACNGCTSLYCFVKLWPFRKFPKIIRSFRPSSIIPLHHYVVADGCSKISSLAIRKKIQVGCYGGIESWLIFDSFGTEINLVLSITQYCQWYTKMTRKRFHDSIVHCTVKICKRLYIYIFIYIYIYLVSHFFQQVWFLKIFQFQWSRLSSIRYPGIELSARPCRYVFGVFGGFAFELTLCPSQSPLLQKFGDWEVNTVPMIWYGLIMDWYGVCMCVCVYN